VNVGLARAFVEGAFIAVGQRLHHLNDRHAWQVGTARCRRERKPEPDEVVRGIADHRLIEIANLDLDAAIRIGDGPEIARMAIAADPYSGTFG